MFSPQIQKVMDHVDALRTQVDDHWQIPRDEALVLAQLVRLGQCRSLCEIGVSYGYSTLHLAAATQTLGGHVHAIDLSPRKIAAATEHLAQAGLMSAVTLHQGDARQVLTTLKPDAPFDFVFIDAVKDQCAAYLAAVEPLLAERAVIITDNTSTHADELAGFVEQLRARPDAMSVHFDVGNGFEFTLIDRSHAK